MARSLTRREDRPRDAVGVRRPGGHPPPPPLPVLQGAQPRDRPGELSGHGSSEPKPTGDATTPESRRRSASGTGSSEHPHLGLRPEHPLLIGSKDQGLLAGHVVRLSGDVALAIEEEHPQQLAGGIKEMHRNDADRAGAAEGSAAQIERSSLPFSADSYSTMTTNASLNGKRFHALAVASR